MSLPVLMHQLVRGVRHSYPMNRHDLLQVLSNQHASWLALLERIDAERMTIPDVEGDWSVKDILAHVVWYEREMVGLLQARRLSGI